MKKIVFAGGCFWGTEAYFNMISGVLKTKVGYANGNKENPTYEEVCRHKTGFVEVCYIEYDEKVLILQSLINAFWKIVDPTLKDRQGNDVGNQFKKNPNGYCHIPRELLKK